jgi:hypothetical protein
MIMISAQEASDITNKSRQNRMKNAKEELKEWLARFSLAVKSAAEKGDNTVTILKPLNPMITNEVLSSILRDKGYKIEEFSLFIKVKW